MNDASALDGKIILVVDDEPDVLEILEEELRMCIVYKARDEETATQYLLSFTFDFVILDIMGVNGFELLKTSVSRGFPTVMLTAHAMTPEALKKSMKLGAVSFLPKEKMGEIRTFLTDVALQEGKAVWSTLFHRLNDLFGRRFGNDWKESDRIFEEFADEVTRSSERDPDNKQT
ncbi:MAG: response regulator [Deltaproteobacteria bacterium]|nr:response regulator [Deltaproteobacteria bacterium]